jgi:methyl-accepting chemotaxis protein
MTSSEKYKNNPETLAIIKPHYVDGATGKAVMTLSLPLWNKQRDTFKGTIAVDIELDEMMKYTKKLNLAKTGFAYLSQSNGNIFAVNETGEKILGLKTMLDSALKPTSGAEYDVMKRFFKDSKYESVKKIDLPTTMQIQQNEIEIKAGNYDVKLDVKSRDEFGRLAETIEKMLYEIRTTFQSLKDQNRALKTELETRMDKERIIKHL